MITPVATSPTVPLAADDEALAGFRRVLRNLATTIDANLEGALDDIDPEFLHELRVAVRRTRSVLTEGKKVLPADVRDRYRDGFRWLGELTGPPRDLDVHLMGWDALVAPLDAATGQALEVVRAELEVRRLEAHRLLAAGLQGARATELLAGWQGWLADPKVTATEPGPIAEVVAHRIEKAQAKVLRDGRAIDESSPGERLHDLRKDAKKLRYLLECFGSLFDRKDRKAFVGQLKDLQENLGAHQDAEVHAAQLHDLARDLHRRPDVSSEVLLAIGQLIAHLEQRRQAERQDFTRRFAAYDTKANRRALEKLVRSSG
jgi:CHAD domain-containing protein